ncbi:efflux transporter outer membrane subunit [Legionella fallonii]|uniref:Outer membrane efflux protein n=1 Tax=Legionella fallonii LLAP-10 TaxID=1212491 RepID=A0A098G928_9GAMM|nr:efflux transporter outer membrane subunit [Legionella fallonii]CEG59004.1 outer membrane efflux protein [Legionella fallonii LLAP-10]
MTLTGCSFGPKYVPPTASVPTNWTEGGANSKPIVNNEEAWWRNFHDPILNNLIEQHSVFNLDLKVAQQRIETARSEYAIASAQLFPTINIAGLPPSGTGVAINQLIALTTSIDPDLFGKLKQNKQRALANMNVSEADRNFALINLYTEITISYLGLREAQARQSILIHNLAGSKQILQFATSQHKAGQAKYIDIAQQKSLIESQLSKLEQNKAEIMAILHKIELLTGNNPGVLAKKLLPVKPIPQITQDINLGVPSDLLRRRPDIIAAEQRVAAAHASIKVAIANLFPQINIGWLLGWQTQTLASNLFAIRNPESTLFGTFNASILDLSLYRTIDLKKREKVLAALQYEIVVMNALHEVEIQYNYCKHYKESTRHLREAARHKRLVLRLSKDSYEKGASDFSTVLRSEEELGYLENAYLQSMVMYQVAMVNLYKALGGGVIIPKEKAITAEKKTL